MAIGEGFTVLQTIFNNTIFLEYDWIISTVLTAVCLLIITRDWDKWAVLAFPIMVMWWLIGIRPSYLLLMLSGILFVIHALSIDVISDVIQTRTLSPRKIKTVKQFEKEREKAVGRSIRDLFKQKK